MAKKAAKKKAAKKKGAKKRALGRSANGSRDDTEACIPIFLIFRVV